MTCRAQVAAEAKWPGTGVVASFLADGTTTDNGTPSNLFASLERHLTRGQWQGAYRRALQAWDAVCALTMSWVDVDGDIRFAGQSMPTDQAGFTYGPPLGLSLLGTQQKYYPAGLPYLNAVVMHEIGHALGLGHSNVPGSIMDPDLDVDLPAKLGSDDIAKIQALYGPPPIPFGPDRYEPNNSQATAKGLGRITSVNLLGLTLHAPDDQDWFNFVAAVSGNFVVTVNFEQVDNKVDSLFVAVFDALWNRLGRASAESSTGKGTVQVSVTLIAGKQYHLRLLSPSSGLFRYSLLIMRGG